MSFEQEANEMLSGMYFTAYKLGMERMQELKKVNSEHVYSEEDIIRIWGQLDGLTVADTMVRENCRLAKKWGKNK